MVLIKSDSKDRNKWPLGIVESLIKGKDGVIRAVQLRSGRDRLERAVQQLYPLEISCDVVTKDGEETEAATLNPNVGEFVPRRKAAVAAAQRIQETLTDD